MSNNEFDQELINDFKEESTQLLKELEDVVESLEDIEESDEFPNTLLEEFSLKIDRIMGAAKTFEMASPEHKGFSGIGKIGELCKKMGYNAVEIKKMQVIPLFAAFWADSLEFVEQFIQCLDDQKKSEEVYEQFKKVLQKRLEWLSKKVLEFGADSSAEDDSQSSSSGNMSQDMVDDLMKDLF